MKIKKTLFFCVIIVYGKVGIFMKFDVPSVVIDKLFNNGYEEQLVDIVMANEN